MQRFRANMSLVNKTVALGAVGISLAFVLIVSGRATGPINGIINRVMGEVAGAASADGTNGGSW